MFDCPANNAIRDKFTNICWVQAELCVLGMHLWCCIYAKDCFSVSASQVCLQQLLKVSCQYHEPHMRWGISSQSSRDKGAYCWQKCSSCRFSHHAAQGSADVGVQMQVLAQHFSLGLLWCWLVSIAGRHLFATITLCDPSILRCVSWDHTQGSCCKWMPSSKWDTPTSDPQGRWLEGSFHCIVMLVLLYCGTTWAVGNLYIGPWLVSQMIHELLAMHLWHNIIPGWPCAKCWCTDNRVLSEFCFPMYCLLTFRMSPNDRKCKLFNWLID